MTPPPTSLARRVAWPFCLAALLLLPRLSRADATLTDCTAATLRAALAAGGTITLDCDGTVALDAPLLVTRDTVLQAGEDREVILSGAPASGTNPPVQILRVSPGVRLILNRLTLVNGRSTHGGAIYNLGWLALNDCAFSNNFAIGLDGVAGRAGADGKDQVGGRGGDGGHGTRGAGGALFNAGTAIVTRCTFFTNGVFGGDGGAGGRGGDGDIQGGNGGHGGHGGNGLGGAIYSVGTLAVTNSSFLDNYAVGGLAGPGGSNGAGRLPSFRGRGGAGGAAYGGGVCALGPTFVWGSTFARNRAFGSSSADAGTDLHPVTGRAGAAGFGGGLCSRGTSVVVNCTFYANTATGGDGGRGSDTDFLGGDGGPGGSAWGGNCYNRGTTWLTNCTLAAGGAFPGLGGAGGNSAGGTNAGGAFPGDPGSDGATRGSNLANDGGTVFLRNCILANPPAGTNTVVTTNVVEVLTPVPTAVLVVSTNVFGTTNCIQLPPTCLTPVVLTNTVLRFAVSTNLYVSADQANDPNCPPVTDEDCFVTVVQTNLVFRSGAWVLAVTTNTFLDPDCSEGVCVTRLVTTNVVAVTQTVTTNLLVLPSNALCFEPRCPTNIVLTNLVSLVLPTFVGYTTNYVTNTVITAGMNTFGPVTDGGYNLSSDATPAFTGTSRNNLDPLLGFFGDHGGPTPTLNLLERSPAIDRADPAFCLATDQRGTNRAFGARCDIGAYEYAAFRIRGRVTDGSRGLAGVVITAEGRSTLTGEDGTYLLSVPPGIYTVTANHPRYTFNPASHTVTVSTLGQSGVGADFTGFRLFALSGQVTFDGLGLAGVQVTLGARSTTTDSQGNFSFTRLPAGLYTVTPVSADYRFQPASVTTNLAANVSQLKFVARGLHRVAGRITNAAGAPLAEVTVSAGGRTAVTDAAGAYALGRFPPGPLTVTPSAPRYDFVPVSQVLNLTADAPAVDFLGQGRFNLGGRITNAAGAPLEGVLVTARSNTVLIKTALTDANGRYLLADLPEGRYVVAASKSGWAFHPPSQERNLNKDRLGVDFGGTRLFTIGGRITEGAEPIPGVVVLIGATNALTDAQGFFLQTVPAGSYTVRPELIGYQFTPRQRTVTVGPDAPTVNFAAQTVGYSVRGRITFQGAGLAGVTVQVGERSVRTDADGAYTILGLPAGDYEVEPVLAGYEFEPPSESVTLGPNVAGVDFEALGALTISGRVRKNGVGLNGVTVSAGPYTAETMFVGFYALEGLPPGQYVVTPSLADHVFDPPQRTVVLTTEDVGPLDFNATELFSLSGRIYLGSRGLAGVVVRLGDRTTTTAADGSYAFTNLLAGDYEVEPRLAGYKFEPDVELVTMGPSLTNVDFDAIGALTLSGYVRKQGVGLPNVQMQMTNMVTLTDSTGFYSFEFVLPGEYRVTPSLADHSFTPPSRQVTLTTNDVEGINFAAAELFSIRGRVTLDGAGLAQVEVSAGGQTVSTDTNGFYAISNLVASSYVVVPARAGYAFEPAQVEVNLGPSTNGVDFVASPAGAPQVVVLWLTLTNQQVRLRLQGAPGQTYQLEAASQLGSAPQWLIIATNLTTDAHGRIEYTEKLATNAPARFYRTVRTWDVEDAVPPR